jgi:chloramphenicol 3-O-phosphotransferase
MAFLNSQAGNLGVSRGGIVARRWVGCPSVDRPNGGEPKVIAQIIILNGVGSVGKSSTAKALQEIAETPFLHVSMDAFLDMLPASMFGHRDGLVFEALEEDGRPSVAIHTGPVMDRAMRGMRRAIAAMAEAGNNLIVDDVMLGCSRRWRCWRPGSRRAATVPSAWRAGSTSASTRA